MFFKKAKKIKEQERRIKGAENYIDFLLLRNQELSRRFERMKLSQEEYEPVRIGCSYSLRRYGTAQEERDKIEECKREVMKRLMERLDEENLVAYDRREDVPSPTIRIFGEIIVLARQRRETL